MREAGNRMFPPKINAIRTCNVEILEDVFDGVVMYLMGRYGSLSALDDRIGNVGAARNQSKN